MRHMLVEIQTEVPFNFAWENRPSSLPFMDSPFKGLLVLLALQKNFIDEESPVRMKGGKYIVLNVIKVVEVARQRGILIVWNVGPASIGSKNAELVDGLVFREGDYKLVKTRFSAFFVTHLHLVLQGAGINTLVVTSVQTPNCIRQTVFDVVALDYQHVIVLVDVTVAATPDIHLVNVIDMKNIGVVTKTLQEWSLIKA
ncbi:hypothetical protein KIW84_052403 [Lathyrus oleraceus]|uniref:Isochorismatase-like domain-containing protein n=1 Tax=Pisum sativum TaxID=3888 RepID=A0A9D4WMK6_PEA|nr:hypothetical protein KIW84_052403 [Pisum sativum]